MRIFFGIIIGLIVAVAIAFAAVKYALGDLGDIAGRDKSEDVTERFELSGFDEIDIGGVFEVDVRVGGDYSVTVSGAEREMHRLEVTVEDGVLKLDQDEERFGKRSWRNQGMTAVITLPELNGLDLAGVADGKASGVDAEAFRIDLAGVGGLAVSGVCGRLDANLSGVGELDARGLECREAEVNVSGVGSAAVFASEAADATVSGVGSIEIYGSPSRIEKNASFISSISVK